ncbi:hypothetical protein A7U60_g1217 [Sanghuangporus baumii]|uniref:GH16 domain-containing protein n=1 Tax=Sanghuangporus baumii TaxID=108892 RepID=A0A9Q5I4J6_SANBA|nr:hypothetical protein A7U60_g1217 [Sanghuangporus baumii]
MRGISSRTRTSRRAGELAAVLALSLGYAGVASAAQSFTMVQNHSGENFLSNWTFYSGVDLNTTGNVFFETQQEAQQEQLTFLNSDGNFVVKVDNTTDGTGNSTFGRSSVKMLSAYTITEGNLVLFDAVHMPFGCSVWPAFWSQGQNWPDDGEIDIIEGVNQQAENKISLHTLDGCTHPDNSSSSSIETGELVSTDCFNQTNGNQGCIVQVPGNSYGESFSSSGGGVYALNWNSSGLYMWFFPRGSIPSDLPTSTPNPDGWGLPVAAYPKSSCNTDQFIKAQTLILDITICGNFAGAADVFTTTGCSGVCTDLVANPQNYDDAFFEISYIRVFSQGGAAGGTVSGGGTSTTGADGSSSTSGSGGIYSLISGGSLLALAILGLGMTFVAV